MGVVICLSIYATNGTKTVYNNNMLSCERNPIFNPEEDW